MIGHIFFVCVGTGGEDEEEAGCCGCGNRVRFCQYCHTENTTARNFELLATG